MIGVGDGPLADPSCKMSGDLIDILPALVGRDSQPVAEHTVSPVEDIVVGSLAVAIAHDANSTARHAAGSPT